ncbi:hypothetical protein GCM10011380_13100 [Sphingomonas metalli]|uniref:DUF418 domain-containing protein n=1 Tax=Sphingomonas metalli TaxID=1779358 RepID=A0A916SZL3_9SPHN|nr:DUF418 domain-containing protein [Sphingomonas metalli]GGB24913.1 hypothetical protein GCM10011380_13100 [Sphingomonas metalli]
MTAAVSAPAIPHADRHLSLDVIRGVAVMGIVTANLPAFGLPSAAYFSPLAAGGTRPLDIALWLINFVLIEGKMRGLFAFLFGASLLLVIERARAAGDDPLAVHGGRMAVLFGIGLIHLYLIWWGDILAHYALCGLIAYPMTRYRTRTLIMIGIGCLVLSMVMAVAGLVALLESAPRATASAQATWNGFAAVFGVPPAREIAAEVAAQRGGWLSEFGWRWHHATGPLTALLAVGPETLGSMFLGMAGLRSGFLTGRWERERYRRWATTGLLLSLAGYTALGCNTIVRGFAMPAVYFASIAVAEPLRQAGVLGFAALIILAMRPGGRLTSRVAAAGRCAFTNYLGTSLVMTFFFNWGLAQFGQWSRASVYALAPLAWITMLAWSAPWLRRHPYGPFEWLWRSLSRAEWQRWRRVQ